MKGNDCLRLLVALLMGWLSVSSSYATNNLRQLFDSLNIEISNKRLFDISMFSESNQQERGDRYCLEQAPAALPRRV